MPSDGCCRRPSSDDTPGIFQSALIRETCSIPELGTGGTLVGQTANDCRIVLDVRPARETVGELRNIRRPADLAEVTATREFAGIASELPTGLDVVRLYENYLSTFAINRGYL